MQSPPDNMTIAEKLAAIKQEHEEQFAIAIGAAELNDNKRVPPHPSFTQWLDHTWSLAGTRGAHFYPFISSMFIFFTTGLIKKFLTTVPLEKKADTLATAVALFHTYLDQVRMAAEMDINHVVAKEAGLNPKPIDPDPVTPKGNLQ